ncbi:hypothetical protein [Nocardioides sambongensis]|uniref:hypothetical protein n=1 Tax=Nocardioides sambongensis TaxID=2589074 RepID=UPI0011292546|nr:hypothetical protein [Nocardioides sambongensis]
MMRIKRPLLATGAAVALGLSLTACGGDAPTNASEEEFCDVVMDQSWYEDLGDDDYEGFVDAAKGYAEDLEEVGTPEGIPDDAREGFTISIDAAKDLDAGEIEDAVKEAREAAEAGEEAPEDPLEAEMSDDEADKLAAFNTYASETCAG